VSEARLPSGEGSEARLRSTSPKHVLRSTSEASVFATHPAFGFVVAHGVDLSRVWLLPARFSSLTISLAVLDSGHSD
jgi:hypothetical protein